MIRLTDRLHCKFQWEVCKNNFCLRFERKKNKFARSGFSASKFEKSSNSPYCKG